MFMVDGYLTFFISLKAQIEFVKMFSHMFRPIDYSIRLLTSL